MKQCMDSDNLHRRLKKIIGQVQAIDRMIDEDIPCEDILSQINAAKSALHKAGQVILEGHIQHCVRDGIQHGDADKTIESFTKAMERFANMKQKQKTNEKRGLDLSLLNDVVDTLRQGKQLDEKYRDHGFKWKFSGIP